MWATMGRNLAILSTVWMATKCLFKILDQTYLLPHRSQNKWKLEDFHLNSDQVQIYLFPHRRQKKKIERLSPWWRPSVFSKYLTKFICFQTGHKRTENWKAFTLIATKCLFKMPNQIYLFPHRSQKKRTLKGLHLYGDQVPFQNTLPNLFVSTQATEERKIESLSPEWRSKYSTKIIYFHRGHKKLKLGRLSPEWRPSFFSKYSTKFIYLHTGHKRSEILKAFTWMAIKGKVQNKKE